MAKRKTWIALYNEARKIKTKEGAEEWLEKTALDYKKRVKTINILGAKILIRENLTYISDMSISKMERDRIKKLFGASRRVFG